MKVFKPIPALLWIMSLLIVSASLVSAQEDTITRPAGWDETSHGSDAGLDYNVVFPQDTVNTITITIAPETWQAMLDDMTTLYGEFGTRTMGGPGLRPGGAMAFQPREGMNPGQPPAGGQPGGANPGQPLPGDLPAGAPLDNQMRGPGGMGGAMLGLDVENPMWAAAAIDFNGQTWTQVGIRFKGNSSLMSSWGGGVYKLPFKLDFDQFEDDYPEIRNQRFYGFQQLSFSSNFSDDSLLREKVTADVFREAGVPAAQTAFYAVYVNYGDGPVYFGLYTAVEVVDDTVIETQFADDSGNVYKPEGTGATFAAGSFDEASFEKETNEDEADYSDILALFDALHADTRTTDAGAWRAGLEAVFDVAGFINWLAVNNVVQNWDTYGSMAHNYYLYHDPTTGLLTWIPWDNNMALSSGFGGGRMRLGGTGNVSSSNMSLDLGSVGSDWPLIRYLMDDPVYHALYVADVDAVVKGAFAPDRMTATYQRLHDLIAPYVVGETGEQPDYTLLSSVEAFDTALTELINHVNQRYTLAQEYVASQAAP